MPGSVPHRNGRTVPAIDRGDPAGHSSLKLLALRHVGTGGQGSSLQSISSGSHASPFGHRTPLHGSLHLQIGQPLVRSRANPAGQNIRHDAAEQLSSAFVQFTFDSSSTLVPGISTPYSSTQKHSSLFSSFEHCTGSKVPSREHLGIRTALPSWPSDLARLDSKLRSCWQYVKSR